MQIGIDASRAFVQQRTGIEEYSYQVIKHLAYRQAGLMNKFEGHEVILYVRKNQSIDFDLPKIGSASWRIKVIKFPYLWTQLGLSLELLFNPVDILFVTAHTVPIIHPRNTVVTIHGLEYEFCPRAYSFWARMYMRFVIKNSCKWAKTIISVSNNTKKDLIKLYKVAENKIAVIYEGYDSNFQFPSRVLGTNLQINSKSKFLNYKPYLLFIGRLEERKNIVGIIKAFEILKEHYKIPHKLILAGKPGFGFEEVKSQLSNVNCNLDIILPGFVSVEDKFDLIRSADVFLFPTFYEGFGIPILEAQSVGVPVVSGNNSSIPEVVGSASECSAILVDPMNAEQIADAAYNLLSDKELRDDIIKKGYENVKRFSWDKCAKEIANLLK